MAGGGGRGRGTKFERFKHDIVHKVTRKVLRAGL